MSVVISNLKEEMKNLPSTPGVYLFKNSSGKVIYVGKAKNLKSRVSSYFQLGAGIETKTYALVLRINDVEVIKSESEIEALILEAELIKKYKPKYNIILKDDKSYLYIAIRKERVSVAGRKKLIAKLITVRKQDFLKTDTLFGPYPDGSTAKCVLKIIRKLLPYRDCSISKFSLYHRKKRPCLFGGVGLCAAPCVRFDEPALGKYSRTISNIKGILSGDSTKIIRNFSLKMNILSKKMDFEGAATYRDLLDKFNYIRQSFRSPEAYLENPYLYEDIKRDSLNDITTFLPGLSNAPRRIECYDISAISGKEAVGSMVVALNGELSKADYRRFKIKLEGRKSDSDMLSEVLGRRLSREVNQKSPRWGLPDLLVVDGGRGQVSAFAEVVDSLGLHVFILGIAKKQETLIYKNRGIFTELSLPRSSLGLKLIIRLRDEAHRFAQSYHHKLRSRLVRRR